MHQSVLFAEMLNRESHLGMSTASRSTKNQSLIDLTMQTVCAMSRELFVVEVLWEDGVINIIAVQQECNLGSSERELKIRV